MILLQHNQTVLDGKVLDHLIVYSVNFSFSFCRRTVAGLEKAFEVKKIVNLKSIWTNELLLYFLNYYFQAIRGEQKQRHYSFPVSHNAVQGFINRLDPAVYNSEQRGDTTTVVHRTSGAMCKFEHARVVGNDNSVYFASLSYKPKHV